MLEIVTDIIIVCCNLVTRIILHLYIDLNQQPREESPGTRNESDSSKANQPTKRCKRGGATARGGASANKGRRGWKSKSTKRKRGKGKQGTNSRDGDPGWEE